uniref:Putative secreted protein n=1 Tax=Amblyomma americanum TaxID=6943 RepID=A0A0C9SEU3_AMBAM
MFLSPMLSSFLLSAVVAVTMARVGWSACVCMCALGLTLQCVTLRVLLCNLAKRAFLFLWFSYTNSFVRFLNWIRWVRCVEMARVPVCFFCAHCLHLHEWFLRANVCVVAHGMDGML